MVNIVISAGCTKDPASQNLKDLDKAIADQNPAAIKNYLKKLNVTSDNFVSDADFATFQALAGMNQPDPKLDGNYSLHILRLMTMLTTTKEAINKSDLTDIQKAQAIKDIKVKVICGGVTGDRFDQAILEPKSEFAVGENGTGMVLVDNSPSGKWHRDEQADIATDII